MSICFFLQEWIAKADQSIIGKREPVPINAQPAAAGISENDSLTIMPPIITEDAAITESTGTVIQLDTCEQQVFDKAYAMRTVYHSPK